MPLHPRHIEKDDPFAGIFDTRRECLGHFQQRFLRGALAFGVKVTAAAGLTVAIIVAVAWPLVQPGMPPALMLAACAFLLLQAFMNFSAQFARVAAGVVTGRLRVNASIPFGAMFGPSVIASFLAAHPDVTIDFSVTDDVVDLLAQNADVAIRMGNLPDSALVARRLGQSRRVVCASPAYLKRKGVPLVPEELREHACLVFNFRRTRVGWPFRVKGHTVEQPVSGPLLVNNGETMK